MQKIWWTVFSLFLLSPGFSQDSSSIEIIEDFEIVEPLDGSAKPFVPPNRLGRFHPAVVHFPIAWFALLFLLELWAIFQKLKRRPAWTPGFRAVELVLICFCLAAVTAAWFSGNALSEEMSQKRNLGDLFSLHYSMARYAFLLVIFAALTKGFALRTQKPGFDWLTFFLVGLGTLTVTLAGHFGGSMVFGKNFLFGG